MGIEIERKYLVDREKWEALKKPAGVLYRQGYISTNPEKTIRVRITPDHSYLTIKGPNTGASRSEFEYEIPIKDAEELLTQFAETELSKTRYTIEFGGKIWEVDEFSGDNIGLITAEIELQSEVETFPIPDWIKEDVTGQEKYYNSNLTLRPFND
ncbi:MAG TPA: adenylate cyclase [Bacteroidetes bacterium]|nr:adenylate cyclase [Bacteroidota bacterium]